MPHSTLTVGNVEITVLHDSEVALPFVDSLHGALPGRLHKDRNG